MTEFVLELRAMPLWLLRKYVTDIGCNEQPDGWLHGDGWRVRLTQIDDFQIGSLRVGQVRFEMVGTAAAVATAWEALEPKLMRAGG